MTMAPTLPGPLSMTGCIVAKADTAPQNSRQGRCVVIGHWLPIADNGRSESQALEVRQVAADAAVLRERGCGTAASCDCGAVGWSSDDAAADIQSSGGCSTPRNTRLSQRVRHAQIAADEDETE